MPKENAVCGEGYAPSIVYFKGVDKLEQKLRNSDGEPQVYSGKSVADLNGYLKNF